MGIPPSIDLLKLPLSGLLLNAGGTLKTGVGPRLQLSVSKPSLTRRDIDMLLSELHKTCPSTDIRISGEMKVEFELAVSFMLFTALRGRSILVSGLLHESQAVATLQ